MKVLVAGASGFLGTALCSELRDARHDVHRLVRAGPRSPDEHRWDPDTGDVDVDLIASADVVVNLAGAPIAHWPWTVSYREQILQSRVRTTGLLARAIADAGTTPAYVVASGMAIHGEDRSSEWLDESSSTGSGFLADVVRAWEQAADPARTAGARVVHLRTGVVLDRRGGALGVMLLPFRLGLAARLGSGRQYFSVISRADWVAAARFLVEREEASGAYNLVGLEPPTNAEFTRALAKALHRPAFLRVPAAPMRLVLGGLAGEVLGSLRMRPTRLVEAGFAHRHRDVEAVVAAALA